MDYLVAPSEPTAWRFPRAEFVRVLLERWPHAEVAPPIPGDTPGVYFKIPEEEGFFSGDLLDNEQTFAFRGEREPATELAIWLRSVIPSSVPLMFFTESGRVIVWLTPSTTQQELLTALDTDRRDWGE